MKNQIQISIPNEAEKKLLNLASKKESLSLSSFIRRASILYAQKIMEETQ